jgi:tRNA1(Val) A37 N6-methylase TrmN6
MGIDSFYTPVHLADKLIDLVKKTNINTIADFCVGDGELLRSSEKRWPKAEIFGVDISEEVIIKNREQHPNWSFTCEDFLESNYDNKFDLILLNPPFSCKGSKINNVVFESNNFKVGTAMQFLLHAVKHLSNNGCLYAILPSSIAFSQKDEMAWNYLKEFKQAKIIDYIERKIFKGCEPNIILVSINDNDSQEYNHKNFIPQKKYRNKIKEIKRGQITPKTVKSSLESGIKLIHTSNMVNNSLSSPYQMVNTNNSIVEGPAVLVPRVGRPSISKLCVIEENEKYAISDCVVSMQTFSNEQALELFNWIIKNWSEFLKLYKGTGAKYLTISKLNKIISTEFSSKLK